MKKSLFLLIALLLGLPLAAVKVWADEERNNVTVPDSEALSDRIEALEKNSPVKIGVLLQVQYLHNSISSLTGNYDQFIGKRAEIKFSGDLKPEKISFTLVYDPLQTPTKQLKDYYGKISYIPYADFQFGQGKYPQGLEGRTPSGDLDFVNRALVSTAFGDKRDLFFQVSGTGLPEGGVKNDYALALVQGAGQNTPENNADKDLAGRSGWQWDDLWVGLSGYLGWEPTGVRDNYGLEGRWSYKGLKLQGEYLQGQLEPGNGGNPIPAVNKLPSNPRGYYLSANYRLEDWRLGARWESYNSDSTVGSVYDVNNDVLTLGVDWFQSKDRFRVYVDFEEHYKQYEAVLTQVEVCL